MHSAAAMPSQWGRCADAQAFNPQDDPFVDNALRGLLDQLP
jgi:hypothetical protein